MDTSRGDRESKLRSTLSKDSVVHYDPLDGMFPTYDEYDKFKSSLLPKEIISETRSRKSKPNFDFGSVAKHMTGDAASDLDMLLDHNGLPLQQKHFWQLLQISLKGGYITDSQANRCLTLAISDSQSVDEALRSVGCFVAKVKGVPHPVCYRPDPRDYFYELWNYQKFKSLRDFVGKLTRLVTSHPDLVAIRDACLKDDDYMESNAILPHHEYEAIAADFDALNRSKKQKVDVKKWTMHVNILMAANRGCNLGWVPPAVRKRGLEAVTERAVERSKNRGEKSEATKSVPRKSITYVPHQVVKDLKRDALGGDQASLDKLRDLHRAGKIAPASVNEIAKNDRISRLVDFSPATKEKKSGYVASGNPRDSEIACANGEITGKDDMSSECGISPTASDVDASSSSPSNPVMLAGDEGSHSSHSALHAPTTTENSSPACPAPISQAQSTTPVGSPPTCPSPVAARIAPSVSPPTCAPSKSPSANPPSIAKRNSTTTTTTTKKPEPYVHRCFNCQSPDHECGECPIAIDKKRVKQNHRKFMNDPTRPQPKPKVTEQPAPPVAPPVARPGANVQAKAHSGNAATATAMAGEIQGLQGKLDGSAEALELAKENERLAREAAASGVPMNQPLSGNEPSDDDEEEGAAPAPAPNKNDPLKGVKQCNYRKAEYRHYSFSIVQSPDRTPGYARVIKPTSIKRSPKYELMPFIFCILIAILVATFGYRNHVSESARYHRELAVESYSITSPDVLWTDYFRMACNAVIDTKNAVLNVRAGAYNAVRYVPWYMGLIEDFLPYHVRDNLLSHISTSIACNLFITIVGIVACALACVHYWYCGLVTNEIYETDITYLDNVEPSLKCVRADGVTKTLKELISECNNNDVYLQYSYDNIVETKCVATIQVEVTPANVPLDKDDVRPYTNQVVDIKAVPAYIDVAATECTYYRIKSSGWWFYRGPTFVCKVHAFKGRTDQVGLDNVLLATKIDGDLKELVNNGISKYMRQPDINIPQPDVPSVAWCLRGKFGQDMAEATLKPGNANLPQASPCSW